MNEQQLQEMINQIPPEVLYAIIQMVINATPEELRKLIDQLQQAMQAGANAQGAEQQQHMPEDGGNQALFGG